MERRSEESRARRSRWSRSALAFAALVGAQAIAGPCTVAPPAPSGARPRYPGRRAALAVSGAVAAGPALAPGAGAEEVLGQVPSAETPKGPPPPSWAGELKAWPGGGWFDEPGEPPKLKWLPLVNEADPYGDAIVYPPWMVGTWDVAYKKKDVRFPQGWGVLGPSLPGVSMASILRLPNIGAEPKAQWRFSPVAGGALTDWSATMPSVLKAFWDKAQATGLTKIVDGWAFSYKSPMLGAEKGTLPERTVNVQWLAGTSWRDDADGSCLSVEWIRQRDQLLAPEGVCDYKVLTALRKDAEGGGVSGLVRVAAFLQPVDASYIEANSEAVAVYDYTVNLTPAASA